MKKIAKKVVCIVLAMTLLVGMTACSCSKDSSSNNGSDVNSDYNALDYVTLGEYKGVTVEINKADYEPTEDKIQKKEIELCGGEVQYEADPSKTIVQKDSIVNVDYEGKLDGVPFDGGSAQNVWIDVANNCDASRSGSKYIDGFTNGVVGGSVGSMADYDITFPENYGSANLAGKHVVFTFTINSIAKDVSAVFTDEYVKAHSSYKSVDELYKAAKEEVTEELADTKKSAIHDKVKDAVIANCPVKSLPDGLLDEKVNEYINTYKKSYSQMGEDFEKSVQSEYNLSMDEFTQQLRQEVEVSLRENIVFEAIAEQEKLTIDESEFKTYSQNLAGNRGVTSVDALYQMFGKDNDTSDGERYIRNIYLCNKALELCVNNAVVNEV